MVASKKIVDGRVKLTQRSLVWLAVVALRDVVLEWAFVLFREVDNVFENNDCDDVREVAKIDGESGSSDVVSTVFELVVFVEVDRESFDDVDGKDNVEMDKERIVCDGDGSDNVDEIDVMGDCEINGNEVLMERVNDRTR